MRTESETANAGEAPARRILRRDLLLGATLLVAILLSYSPALRNGFIWDDDAYVTANSMLTAPDGLQEIWFSAHTQSQYFPLTYTTLRLERALWGLNPLGYHLFNILLHAANGMLVWVLLRRLAVPAAWLGAALFALHPVQVETVAWVTELKNTQSTLFYLLALWAWIEFNGDEARARWRSYALAIVCGALALLSKTTACTLPAAMILVQWLMRRPFRMRQVAALIPFFLMSLAMGLLSVWWEGHLGNYVSGSGVQLGALDRLLIASRAIWFYLFKLLWPANLTFSYPRWTIRPSDPAQYGWVLACLAVAALGWTCRRRLGRGPLAAAAFYAATLSPMLGFFPLYTFIYTFVADHYQYLACAGPLAAFAVAAAHISQKLRLSTSLQTGMTVLLLGVLGGLTWHQCLAYHDRETLWRDTLQKNPGSWLALNNLGVALADRGKTAEAEQDFLDVIQRVPDLSWSAHNALGMLRASQGRPQEAEAQFLEALRLRPDDPEVHYNLANLLAATGRINDAIVHYERALEHKPGDPDIRNNLGVAFYSVHQLDAAVQQFRLAVRFQPDSPRLHCNLGNALLARREVQAAAQEYEQALHLDPNCAEAALRLKALTARESNGP